MSMQPCRSWARTWGPFPETGGIPPEDLRACGEASFGERVPTADGAATAGKGLHSIPNDCEGDAVRQVAKDKVVRLFPGVQVGAQIVARDASGGFNTKHPLRGNLPSDIEALVDVLPGDRLLGGELPGAVEVLGQPPRQLGGVDDLKNLGDDVVGHGDCLVSHRHTDVNRRELFLRVASRDDDAMSDTPKPDHFEPGDFKGWLEAARRTKGLSKAELARAVHIGRAAVNKWYQGGHPGVDALQRIAIWANLEYSALRLLVDGVAQPGSHRARVQAAKLRSPKVEYIASRLDQLADDEGFMTTVEDMVDAQMKRRAQVKQKKQAS